jgi:hypothetical protein
MSSELLIQFLEILGIPVVASFILTFIKVATGGQPFVPEMGVDIGMDLSILAAGAIPLGMVTSVLILGYNH